MNVAEDPGSLEDALDAVARAAESPEALLHDAFEAVQRRVANVGSLLYRYDAQGRFETLAGSLAVPIGAAEPALFDPANDASHRAASRLAARPRIVQATAAVSRRAYHRSPAYRVLYREHGVEHITCAWIDGSRPFTPGMRGFMLARGESDGELTDGELSLLRRTLPLLTRAAGRLEEGERPEAASMLVDVDGRASQVDADVEAQLAGFGLTPDDVLSRIDGPLRRWSELRRELALARFAGGERLFHLVEREGRTLYVEVTERRYGWRVRLRTERGAVQLAALRARHGLTPAEIYVLQALGLGLSNAEIAAYLCLSAETVKTHVARLLRKLGLGSRLQAGLLIQRVVLD